VQIKSLDNLKYSRLWFSCQDYFLTPSQDLSKSINYFIQCPNNVNDTLNEFYTLLIDLKEPIATIQGNIYHRTTTEINSFIKNQKFEHQLLLNLSKADLNFFISLFNQFAKYKHIRKAEAFRLKAYNKSGILAISFIKQENTFLCINFYRVTQNRATNLYSFHLKHASPHPVNSSHFGRAHRALHWLDIVKFKELAVAYYDFCGWYAGSSDKDLLNINKFKEQFTQHKVKEYSGVIYKNKLLLFLIKLLRNE
jgi:hypothetical protein